MEASQLSVSDVVSILLVWLFVWYRWSREPTTPMPTVQAGQAQPLIDPPFVSVIVPARNEAHHIAACVTSLLAQDYSNLEVIVVDDGSTDGTGACVAALANGDPRLTLVRGAPLPEHWMGKAHACHQGYARAKGTWLLFTDADTEHAPFLLSGVMAVILKAGASVATVLGQQRHPCFGVYLANLSVFTYIFLVTDPKGLADPQSRQSLVNGQYLLFTREAYEAIGTHAAVRSYSSTDVSLGYLSKLHGWVPLYIDGRAALQTTMYRNFKEAFHGWARSLVNGIWTALGPGLGSLVLLTITIALWLFWVDPWWRWFTSLARHNNTEWVVSSCQILAGLALIRLRIRNWAQVSKETLLMPAAFMLFTVMVVTGLTQGWVYRGTMWKGRVVRTGQRLPPWRPAPRRDANRKRVS
ncbi:MAG TPA: glycosyltransferase [Nitrospiraceae bacterium]|nr:glycosyltransferase [Nitrospiraceae bacterium]